MPYRFNFRINDRQTFSCFLETMQCVVIKPDNSRCKNKICIGSPYCYVHLLYEKHLRIKKSTLPRVGKGLFAMNPKLPSDAVIFKKDENIIQYTGEIIDDEEKARRYEDKTGPYLLLQKQDTYIDSAKVRGVASNANTYPSHNNAYFALDNRNNKVYIKANKNIKNGEEIFVSYGRSYKLNEEGVEFKTTYVSK